MAARQQWDTQPSLAAAVTFPQVAIRRHPLEGGLTAWTALAVAYLTLFVAYWLVALVRVLAASWPGCAVSSCPSPRMHMFSWPRSPPAYPSPGQHPSHAPTTPSLPQNIPLKSHPNFINPTGAPGGGGAGPVRDPPLLQPQAGHQVGLSGGARPARIAWAVAGLVMLHGWAGYTSWLGWLCCVPSSVHRQRSMTTQAGAVPCNPLSHTLTNLPHAHPCPSLQRAADGHNDVARGGAPLGAGGLPCFRNCPASKTVSSVVNPHALLHTAAGRATEHACHRTRRRHNCALPMPPAGPAHAPPVRCARPDGA